MLHVGKYHVITEGKKKADVAKHSKVFGHIGLLFSEPPGRAELLSV